MNVTKTAASAPTSSMTYNVGPAVIAIRKLRLRTFIGFNPEELTKQQDVVINAEIQYHAENAIASDFEEDALDYKIITKQLIALVENGRFKLLETLTAQLLAHIMEDPRILQCVVSVDKPHALRFSDSVSVTLSAHRS